jgi:phenol hydroxylase P5 protein
VRIENLTPTIKGVWLSWTADHFQAGQYVNLHAWRGAARAFSIASAGPQPRDRAQHAPRAGRQGHHLVHQQLQVGERVQPRALRALLRAAHRGRRLAYLFMAGGSGLSSPRSMILDLLAAGCDKPITLVNGAQPGRALHHDDEPRPRAPQLRHVRASGASPRTALDGARGFVHDAAKAHFATTFAATRPTCAARR